MPRPASGSLGKGKKEEEKKKEVKAFKRAIKWDPNEPKRREGPKEPPPKVKKPTGSVAKPKQKK